MEETERETWKVHIEGGVHVTYTLQTESNISMAGRAPPFTPPPDYLPQIIPVSIGITIAFLSIVELADHIKVPHVLSLLAPLCFITLAQCVMAMVSLTNWYPYRDFPFLRQTLITLVVLQMIYNALDSWIYVLRVRSILSFYPWWRMFTLGFLAFKFLWIFVFQVLNLRTIIQSLTPLRLFSTVSSPTSKIHNLSSLIAPALQAILVDVSLLFVIIRTLRAAGRLVHASPKRVSRICLLVGLSCTFLFLEVLFGHSDAVHSLVVSGTNNIVLALGAYVNIDLYLLDLVLFLTPAEDQLRLPTLS